MDKNEPKSAAGAALQQFRQRVEGTCPICGATFTGYTGKPTRAKRYCSASCRKRAERQRKAAPPDAPRSGAGEETP